jgi:hypothetical protein
MKIQRRTGEGVVLYSTSCYTPEPPIYTKPKPYDTAFQLTRLTSRRHRVHSARARPELSTVVHQKIYRIDPPPVTRLCRERS